MQSLAKILTKALDIGEALLISGAEVSRVEDTLRRLLTSYGADKADVLTITSGIVVTVRCGSESMTETRRVKGTSTDFDKLSSLNALSRYICENKPDAEEIEKRLAKIETKAPSKARFAAKKCVGSILAAGGFAVFFGGNAADFLLASLIALLICAFEMVFRRKEVNLPSYYFICTLLSGVVTLILGRFFGSVEPDKVMIGFIMLLIPGLSFTNSARDFLLGDTISGSLRLLESLLYAACIAAGVALSILLMGGAA